MNCQHGEVVTDVARHTTTCRICGASVTLPQRADPRPRRSTLVIEEVGNDLYEAIKDKVHVTFCGTMDKGLDLFGSHEQVARYIYDRMTLGPEA